jgi:pimeloyl-ACP methyl ester carboxylesterase
MTAIFVHGVPETAAIWDRLIAAVDRDDCVALELPGFGSSLPDGFEPTMYRYAEWLAAELTAFDEVDLVGHDWGALLAVKVLADGPANVRTWALDIGDMTDDFRWHDAARTWQTPGEGEALIDGWVALDPAARAEPLVGAGAPPEAARLMGEALDSTMGMAILGLYRSAVDIGVEWGPGIDRWDRPGLVIASQDDPFRKPELARALADRTGARIVELEGVGHWWMHQVPDQVAAELQQLWDSV